jgi:hypothetical protein
LWWTVSRSIRSHTCFLKRAFTQQIVNEHSLNRLSSFFLRPPKTSSSSHFKSFFSSWEQLQSRGRVLLMQSSVSDRCTIQGIHSGRGLFQHKWSPLIMSGINSNGKLPLPPPESIFITQVHAHTNCTCIYPSLSDHIASCYSIVAF